MGIDRTDAKWNVGTTIKYWKRYEEIERLIIIDYDNDHFVFDGLLDKFLHPGNDSSNELRDAISNRTCNKSFVQQGRLFMFV